MSWKKSWKRFWYFVWEDNSLASWLVNIIIAFVLIKFLIYPGLGLVMGTNYPVVAVVSGSMEHNMPFDNWWSSQSFLYEKFGISQEDFLGYDFKNGFNKGDIMVLRGIDPAQIRKGDVIVYYSARRDPIIHRVVAVTAVAGAFHYETKGDNNLGQIISPSLDETDIRENQIIGKGVFRIPLLGWVKIIFVDAIKSIIS